MANFAYSLHWQLAHLQTQKHTISITLPSPLGDQFPQLRTRFSDKELLFSKSWTSLESTLIRALYESNLIESAGCSSSVKTDICRYIFEGSDNTYALDPNVTSSDIDAEYAHLLSTGRQVSWDSLIQARREVVNHAAAFSYFIDHVILQGKKITEDLILFTHALLHESIVDDDAGQYRDHEVAVLYGRQGKKNKKSIFMRASAVPQYMAEMIGNLERDLNIAEETGQIDIYNLVAKYHHQFVMIHPFSDGNGRMTRIMMNTLLLKYAGHCIPFGAGDDRSHYLEMVTRAHRVFDTQDMEAGFEEQTCHLEFAEFLASKTVEQLQDGILR